MGEVFAAENIRTGRPVAIKLLRQDSKLKSSAVARFRQEARAAGSINSDHVTQVLDVEEDAEHGVVLVFELLEGESLIDRLKRTGPIPFDELYAIIEQVWMGLADAHRAGIIHRDLKPSNVFLERRPDGTTRVKILDFGISKVPKEVGGETLTEMGQSLGTFSFMPPEQIGKAKMVDHRADIYACATLIYQSLTGQLPYAARNILVMVEMKSKSDARKLSEAMSGPIDPRLESFVAKGLAREPGARFQTAVEALAVWRELKPGPSSGAPASKPSSSTPSPGTFAGHAGASTPSGSGAAEIARAATRAGSNPRLVATPIPTPKIVEAASRLPSVADMTTEESIATIAMPRAQIGGNPAQSGNLPRLDPRLDSAAASIGGGQAGGSRGVGPGGTQLVMVPRGGMPLGDRRAPTEDPGDSANLKAHPVGYYIPPSVAASLGRSGAQGAQAATPAPPAAQAASGAQQAQPAQQGIPRIYDEPLAQSSSDGAATQVYRPTGDTSRRLQVDPAVQAQAAAAMAPTQPQPPQTAPPQGGAPQAAQPAPPPQPAAMQPPAVAPPSQKRGMPIWMVLVGFLVIGFGVVAGALWLFNRR
jgi:serine/threonine protein kinase